MIREGQQAKVTYCKEATFSSPIPANAKRPHRGNISNGLETARQVVPAIMTRANLHDSKTQVNVGHVPVNDVRVKTVSQGKIITCTEMKPQIQEKYLSSVAKDITLDKLFH